MSHALETRTGPYLARKDVWLVLGVWLALSLLSIARQWHDLIQSTGSTDDTMRLHGLRDLLAGKGWFAGLHDARLGPPDGLDSHWSRLVDVPLALLYLIAKPFLGTAGAEVFVSAAWPALLYLALIAGYIVIGKRLAPTTGFVPLLAGILGCLQINYLFLSNSLDHHNLMLALALWLFACLVWLDMSRLAAYAGGVIAAALIATGFESLHIYAVLNIFIVLRTFYDPARFEKPVFVFLMTQAICIGAFWLITVPPQLLAKPMCDAIAINTVLASVGACLTATALIRFVGHWSFATKSAAAVAGLGVLAGLALAMEPLCVKGPNAMIDPRAIEVWLSGVREAASLFEEAARSPRVAVLLVTYPILCLLAFIWLRSKKEMTVELYVLLACVAAATLVTVVQLRGGTYAALFGALFVTLAATRLKIREPFGRVARIIVPGFASSYLLLAVMPFTHSNKGSKMNDDSVPSAATVETSAGLSTGEKQVRDRCAPRWGFPSLQDEPMGYVLSHINLGPSLLLHTEHDVMMAPYHRISKSIAFGYDLTVTPLVEARQKLAAEGITHLADCMSLTYTAQKLSDRADKTPLLQDVMRGEHQVDWVEALPADPRRPEIKIWRIKR
jgi:hypothetical protein